MDFLASFIVGLGIVAVCFSIGYFGGVLITKGLDAIEKWRK